MLWGCSGRVSVWTGSDLPNSLQTDGNCGGAERWSSFRLSAGSELELSYPSLILLLEEQFSPSLADLWCSQQRHVVVGLPTEPDLPCDLDTLCDLFGESLHRYCNPPLMSTYVLWYRVPHDLDRSIQFQKDHINLFSYFMQQYNYYKSLYRKIIPLSLMIIAHVRLHLALAILLHKTYIGIKRDGLLLKFRKKSKCCRKVWTPWPWSFNISVRPYVRV